MRGIIDFILLCGVGFFSFASYNLVRMPALAPFAESLGAGPMTVGLVVAASTMTGVILKFPIGALSDILGRRKLMFVGVLAFALPPFVYPSISDLEVLVVVRVVHGLATAIFTPLALASVAAMHEMQRGVALGWYTSATQGGALLGPVLGGWLVDASGFSSAFETAGIVGLLALGLYGLILCSASKENQNQKEATAVIGNLLGGLRKVICHSQMLMTSVAEAAKMIANGTLMAFLPLYALSVGLTLVEGGILFGVQGFTSFLSKPIMGRVSDCVGRQPLIVLGLVICGGTIAGIPQVTQFPELLLLAAGFGFGEAVVTSSSAAFIADLSDSKNLGAGMGLRGTVMDIGHAAGPILAGVLVAGISYTVAFALIGLIQIVAALSFWLVAMRWPKARSM